MKTTAPNPDWPKVVCCWFAFRIKRAKKFQHLDLKCFRVMVCIDNTFRFSSCTSTVQPTTKYVMKTLPAMHNCTFHSTFLWVCPFLVFFFFKYLHFQKRFKFLQARCSKLSSSWLLTDLKYWLEHRTKLLYFRHLLTRQKIWGPQNFVECIKTSQYDCPNGIYENFPPTSSWRSSFP